MDVILRLVSDSDYPSRYSGADLEITPLATGQWYVEGSEQDIQEMISAMRRVDQIDGEIIVCSNVLVMI